MANESWRRMDFSHLMCFAVKYSNPTKTAKIKAIYTLPNRPTTIHKVLIVDDEPILLSKLEAVVKRKLGTMVLKIDPKGNLPIEQQVRRIIEEEAPDMALMDYHLGKAGDGQELTGIKLIHEMRAGGFTGYIVANSTDPVLNWEMTDNGADFAVFEKYRSGDKANKLSSFLRKYVTVRK